MEKQQLTLRERQLEYLRILKELDRYCTEKGLRYYIGCGTLIGAVRHKGFIPWDDDLDVFMPRPDFLQMNRDYKSDAFSFHTIYNDKSHPYNFGRLCSGDIYSSVNNKKLFNFGIDVYVINGAPSERAEQLKHMDETFVHIKRKEIFVRLRCFLIKYKLWLRNDMNFSLMNKELMKAERCFGKYDYETSEFIWPYGGGHLIMRKENYGTPIKLLFEDGLFSAPEHYHEVLTLGYGDYMTLPPEEKRQPYHSGTFYRK